MAFDAVGRVIALSRKPGYLSDAEMRLLLNLADRMNAETGQLNPSLPRLAEDMGRDRRKDGNGVRHVRRLLDQLVSKRLVTRIGSNKGGRGQSQWYRLTLPDPSTDDPVTAERGAEASPFEGQERGAERSPFDGKGGSGNGERGAESTEKGGLRGPPNLGIETGRESLSAHAREADPTPPDDDPRPDARESLPSKDDDSPTDAGLDASEILDAELVDDEAPSLEDEAARAERLHARLRAEALGLALWPPQQADVSAAHSLLTEGGFTPERLNKLVQFTASHAKYWRRKRLAFIRDNLDEATAQLRAEHPGWDDTDLPGWHPATEALRNDRPAASTTVTQGSLAAEASPPHPTPAATPAGVPRLRIVRQAPPQPVQENPHNWQVISKLPRKPVPPAASAAIKAILNGAPAPSPDATPGAEEPADEEGGARS